MSEQRHALRVSDPARIVQLLVVVLMFAILGALALHHSDDADGTAVGTDFVAGFAITEAADVPSAQTFAGAFAWQSGDEWMTLAISGCAALGLCCVIGLALAKKSAISQRNDAGGTLVRTVWASIARWDSSIVLASRPCLNSLSISRT